MYPPITYSLLVEKKACKPQLDLFKKHFGKTKAIPLTKKVVTQFGSVFDINWASENLLTQEDLAEYNKAHAPILAEYNKANAPILAEYEKAHALIWAEYKKAHALEFVRIYKKGMKKT
jgi:hypothetical protein